jgi:hypothetical protein
MSAKWRVIAFDKDGQRVVVDEGLSQDEALSAAAAMLTKGHNVTIEAELCGHVRGAASRRN